MTVPSEPKRAQRTAAEALAAARACLDAVGTPLQIPRAMPPQRLKRRLMRTMAVVGMTSLTLSHAAVGVPTPSAPAAAATAPLSAVDIRVGRNTNAGRIEIYGSIGSRASVRRDKGVVIVRFPGQVTPDLRNVRVNPPAGVTGVELKSDARATELWIRIGDTYTPRFGREAGAVFIQLESSGRAQASSEGTTLSVDYDSAAAPAATAPATASGVPILPVSAEEAEGGRELSFAFDEPVPAAIFRRGEAVWIIFDSDTDLRLSPALKDGRIIRDAQWTRSQGFVALRLYAPSAGTVTATSEGGTWRVRIGGRPLDGKAAPIAITRDDSTGVPSIMLNMAGASRVVWVRDPSVGDRMAVVTARGPVKRLTAGRAMVDASLGATSHGAMVEVVSSDVKVDVDGDIVGITRAGGLTLSPRGDGAVQTDHRLEYLDARYPALMNAQWAQPAEEGFLQRYNALQRAAAEEAAGGLHAPTRARLSLARFLVGQGLAFEAQGVLDLMATQSPRSMDDPQVRGLRAIAKIMCGRTRLAAVDLAAPQLAADPATRLWQGYLETEAGHYEDAVKHFKAGAPALDVFPDEWRVRIAAAFAKAALLSGDLLLAEKMIAYATAQTADPLTRLEAYAVQAAVIEAGGDKARALRVYEAVGGAPSERIAVPAIANATRLKLELKEMKPAEAVQVLEGLRYRWRGDDTEFTIVEQIAGIYFSQGQYRQALSVLSTVNTPSANSEGVRRVQAMQSKAFRDLFLGGRADGLQPIEALGLFNDYRELTPVGADGDEMVRKIVRRLVDVDLLDQAAELLEYQIENRLEGPARAQVATDLAAIYLMNRKPEKALQILWKTRTTLLPRRIMDERRLFEARALTQLNRPEDALEMLGNDRSAEADDIRADIYWRQQNWKGVGTTLERLLGERWKRSGPLSPVEEGRVIRAGVAYSLNRDDASLGRISERYGKFVETASAPDAMRVALAPFDEGPVTANNFAATAASVDGFSAWVNGMKKRFREREAST